MRSLLLVFIRPRKFAEIISDDPKWVAALAVVALLQVLVAFFMHGQIVEGVMSRLPTDLTVEDRASVRGMLDEQRMMEALFKPFGLVVESGLAAVLLFGTLRLVAVRRRPRIAHLFSLVVHAELVLALSQWAILMRNALPGAVAAFDPLFSAGSLLSNSSSPLTYLLNSFSLFHLWFIGLLVVGLVHIAKIGWTKAILIALFSWFVVAGVNTLILAFLIDFFHFML